jgi:MinD-like ATPase involved in chromosome partitioning or flagellar assembly
MSASGRAAAGAPATSVLLAAAGAGWEAEALERLSRGGPSVVVTKRCVDLTDLLGTAAAGTAAVAVVSPALPGLDADSLASLRRSGLGVVAVASAPEMLDGDAERMRRIGADHVLSDGELAVLADTVRAAAAATATGPAGGPHHAAHAHGGPDGSDGSGDRGAPAPAGAAGRVLAVWGPAGAPGRTTVAVGLAGELARAGREVLLVDADAYGGSVAQHLGVLDEVSGLLAAARAANAGQLDAARLAAVARSVGPGLRVLTGLPRPDRWQEVRQAAFEEVLSQATRLAAHVVLDLGFSLEREPGDPFGGGPQRNLMTLAGLERADEILVVGAADPVGLARLARGLVELGEVLRRPRPRVVVNRTRSSLGWSDQEIRGMVEGFGRPLAVHFLPEDRAAADRALMAGHSLAECRDSALRTAVREVADAVLGDTGGSRPARGLRRRRAGRAR